MITQTSPAVKACVNYIDSLILPTYNKLFSDFYSIDRSFEEQFDKYYAKIPNEDKQKPWVTLMYSYDMPKRNGILNREFMFKRLIGQVNRQFTARNVSNSVLFTIVTNDALTVEEITENIIHYIDWSFSTTFLDLMWPERLSRAPYLVGARIRPPKYTGLLFEAQNSGYTGVSSIQFPQTIGSTIIDGDITWKAVEADKCKVQVQDLVVSDVIEDTIDKSMTRFRIDFGGTMYYQIIRDTYRGDGTGGRGLVWTLVEGVWVPSFAEDGSWTNYSTNPTTGDLLNYSGNVITEAILTITNENDKILDTIDCT
jgi:hypothetical protein